MVSTCYRIFSKHHQLHQSNKNENFVTWPGIDNLNFATLLRTTTATELGHPDQERSNLQSDQQQEDEEEDFPSLK